MRGYVEMLERLEYFAPEGHEVTDAEVCEALADQMAQRIDAARDLADFDATPTVAPPLAPCSITGDGS